MIYIVTRGAYSDYGIVGATTDKAKAEEMCELYGDCIEQFEDCKIDFKNKKMYCVDMYKNGDTKRVIVDKYVYDSRPDYTIMYDGTLNNYCWATDEQHAVKITNELRTRLIAEGEWK